MSLKKNLFDVFRSKIRCLWRIIWKCYNAKLKSASRVVKIQIYTFDALRTSSLRKRYHPVTVDTNLKMKSGCNHRCRVRYAYTVIRLKKCGQSVQCVNEIQGFCYSIIHLLTLSRKRRLFSCVNASSALKPIMVSVNKRKVQLICQFSLPALGQL